MSEYIPGTCNINTAERAYRRKAGYAGLGLFLVLLVVISVVGIQWLKVILFIPAYVAAIGFLQAKHSFCVGYAAAGQQNASDKSKSASQIEDLAAVAKDKLKAKQLNIQAGLYAILATAITFVLPVL